MKLKRILLALLLLPLVLVAVFYRADIPVEELLPRYADEASRFLDYEGLSVHYKDEGTGPALLLLHGTSSSLHAWDSWVESLREDFRIVRLDLPNFGLTGPPPKGTASLEDQFTTLDALLDHLGIEQVAVAGNSLGGLIAWRYAAHAPSRVIQLILINSAGAPPADAATETERRSSIFDLARNPILGPLLTRLTPRFLVRDGLEQVYFDDSLISPELVDRHYDLLLREGNRIALLRALQNRGPARSELLPTLPQPALVQWGEEDPWIPLSAGKRLAEALPQGRLVVYPDIGHVPMEEAPSKSAADARAFLMEFSTLESTP